MYEAILSRLGSQPLDHMERIDQPPSHQRILHISHGFHWVVWMGVLVLVLLVC
jgi:hypothetical protein